MNKTATQSSTHASGAAASRAVDGNTDGVFANGSVTHTLSDANAWWQVDLGQVQTIDTIKIWNRVESPERLSNFYVFVSDEPARKLRRSFAPEVAMPLTSEKLGHGLKKTLAETAKAAVGGDRTAETAIKIAKQAGRLGQKN